MNFNIFVLTACLLLPLAGPMGCAWGPPQDQNVIVRPVDLKEGVITTPGENQQAAPIIVDQIPEKNIRDGLKKLFPNEPILVITTKEFVKPAVPDIPAIPDNPATPEDESKPAVPGTAPKVVPITPPTDENGNINFGEWAKQGIPAILGLVPAGTAPWVPLIGYGLGLLFNKRPRQHLADLIGHLNPADGGYVDIKAAAGSLSKAVGFSHTNETPEQLRAVADKLEAKETLNAKIEATKGE